VIAKAKFSKGDRVMYHGRRVGKVYGTVKRVNKLTLAIKPDDGGPDWRVDPRFLRHTDVQAPERSL
jgi:hypothetical protein